MHIGLTMRTTREPDSGEERDALARDWLAFLEQAAPGATPVLLPNLGAPAAALARELGVTALVLTGGDDIGAAPQRDRTEAALLGAARSHRWPVLGVCRGFQFINHTLGGTLAGVDPAGHVRARHQVRILAEAPGLAAGSSLEVNSYHCFGIPAHGLAPGLIPLAVDADGFVEAAMAKDLPLAGVMWHPERESPAAGTDLALFCAALGLAPGRTRDRG